MPNPIGGRLQPSREAVEALLKSRKGKLVSTTPKEPKVTLREPRLHGNVQGVGKRGEWKTIDQRELSASRSRRTQRRGKAAVVAGGTTAVTAYAAGSGKGTMTVLGNRNKTWEEASELRQSGKNLRDYSSIRRSLGAPIPLRSQAQAVGHALRTRPLGAALIGGAALAGVGGVGYGQGKAREAYHQNRINARRKANLSRSVGKRAPMDHESSGFARYGDGSTKGKRLPDEFSKALNPSQAKRLTTVKGKKDWGVENVRERQAIYSRIGIANRQNRVVANPKGNWEVSDGMPRAMRRRGLTYSDAERHMNKKPTTGDAGGVFKRIRNKDAESDRQRRLGMATAATAVGSGLLLRRGVGGAIKTTRALRASGDHYKASWKKTGDTVRSLVDHADHAGNPVKGKGIGITSRQLAHTAGGTALGGASLGLEHYSRGRRNRRWE